MRATVLCVAEVTVVTGWYCLFISMSSFFNSFSLPDVQMNYLAKTSEEYNQKAFLAEQNLKRVEREKEALAEELQKVRDHNVMAARLQQAMEWREEMERRLMEVQGEKQELQKQKEVSFVISELCPSQWEKKT